MVKATRLQKKDSFLLAIGGKKRDYPVRELPEEFIRWNLGRRIFMLRKMLDFVESKEHSSHGHGGGAGIFGYHLPVYITHNQESALFPANAAVKGTGFVAKEEYLDYYIEKFQKITEQTEEENETSNNKTGEAARRRIETILEFYENTDKIDLRCLSGLEIWPGTTSRNFTLDPRVSLHFLGMPSPEQPMRYHQWQVNCIWEKITPENKRFRFGVALRQLTMGHIGRSFVPGHIPAGQTPIKGRYPYGWTLWVVETLDKGIDALSS